MPEQRLQTSSYAIQRDCGEGMLVDASELPFFVGLLADSAEHLPSFASFCKLVRFSWLTMANKADTIYRQ